MSADFCSSALPYVKSLLDKNTPVDVSLTHNDSPVLRELGNGLAVAYLVDEGSAFRYVQHRHLDEAGLNAEALHNAAIRNLANHASTHMRLQPYANIFPVFLGGHFEASLMLLDSLWDETFVKYAPNGFMIAIPARDILAFCDVGSRQGIKELHEVVERAYQNGDHLISSALYRRIEGAWHPYTI